MVRELYHKAFRDANSVVRGFQGSKNNAKNQAKAITKRIGNKYDGYDLVNKSNKGTSKETQWIMQRGSWNDDGLWDDSKKWHD